MKFPGNYHLVWLIHKQTPDSISGTASFFSLCDLVAKSLDPGIQVHDFAMHPRHFLTILGKPLVLPQFQFLRL